MENLNQESKEVKRGWNWGAFMMPLQFGIGNKAYLCLLTLVPVLNVVWAFVSGAKAAQWAYEGNAFANDDEFNGAMESWNRAGKVMAIIFAVIIVLYIILAILLGSFISSLF